MKTGRLLLCRLAGVFAIGAALTGCETTSPAEQAALTAEANQPIICNAGPDCEMKWGRALQWVLNNSTYKIQSQSDTMISTMGPLPNEPAAAFTVTKTLVGTGLYSIEFRGGCDNIFGCIPSLVASKASFVSAVTGH